MQLCIAPPRTAPQANAGLADVQSYWIDLGWAPSVEEALSKMMEAAETAVQLDPGDAATGASSCRV